MKYLALSITLAAILGMETCGSTEETPVIIGGECCATDTTVTPPAPVDIPSREEIEAGEDWTDGEQLAD